MIDECIGNLLPICDNFLVVLQQVKGFRELSVFVCFLLKMDSFYIRNFRC